MIDRNKSSVALCACALFIAHARYDSSNMPVVTAGGCGMSWAHEGAATHQPFAPVLPCMPIERALHALSNSTLPQLRTHDLTCGIPHEAAFATENDLAEYLAGSEDVGRLQSVLPATDSIVYRDPHRSRPT